MKVRVLVSFAVCLSGTVCAQSSDPVYHSPIALVSDPAGARIYAIDETASQVVEIDSRDHKVVRSIPVPGRPNGAALDPSADRMYVTTDAPVNSVFSIDLRKGAVESRFPAGHGPTAPVLAAGGSLLYVCNRFDNDVSVIDLGRKRTIKRIAVIREPVAAALSTDGKMLVVGNQKPAEPATAPAVASVVSLIDTQTQTVSASVRLPNGGVDIRGIAISGDDHYAFVSHVLSRSHVPATQLEQGWLNTNAISVVDLQSKSWLNTILLDEVERGAGNPWGVALSEDGKKLCVALAGVHQLDVIELPQLLEKLRKLAAQPAKGEYHPTDTPDTDLTFLESYARRISLKGRGPRPILVRGGRAYLGMYFSGTIESVDLASSKTDLAVMPLGQQPAETGARRGERLFNDASLSFQGWQSCSTCHPDARSDGLNWDLTNDGVGTARNTKSLLFAFATPPLTWTGIFPTIEDCVPYELRTALFASRPKEDIAAIVAYLKSVKEIPSPYLQNGHLSPAAKRGEQAFAKAGCNQCHSGEYMTAMQKKHVIISALNDRSRAFDIPSLREAWRTAPYLHDGRAPTIKDIFMKFDPENLHGKHSVLTRQELDDLVQYVLSL